MMIYICKRIEICIVYQENILMVLVRGETGKTLERPCIVQTIVFF